MPLVPGPFGCGQIALGLSRRPGRQEADQEEADRILNQIKAWWHRGQFADDEVVARFGDPPQLRPLAELVRQQAARWDPSLLEWRYCILLTFAAAKRFVEASTVDAAHRLLHEWFTPTARRHDATAEPVPTAWDVASPTSRVSGEPLFASGRECITDRPANTGYREYFHRRVRESNEAARAQRAADASVEWLSYPQAVQLVLPVLFSADWAGLATEQEKVVLSLGPAHRDWRRYSELHAEREAQIARAEWSLLVNGLIEEDRHGTRRVRAAALREALAAGQTPTRAAARKDQAPEAAAGTMRAAAQRWLADTYANGIPAGVTNKMLAERYRKETGGPMSARTISRARQPART